MEKKSDGFSAVLEALHSGATVPAGVAPIGAAGHCAPAPHDAVGVETLVFVPLVSAHIVDIHACPSWGDDPQPNH